MDRQVDRQDEVIKFFEEIDARLRLLHLEENLGNISKAF